MLLRARWKPPLMTPFPSETSKHFQKTDFAQNITHSTPPSNHNPSLPKCATPHITWQEHAVSATSPYKHIHMDINICQPHPWYLTYHYLHPQSPARHFSICTSSSSPPYWGVQISLTRNTTSGCPQQSLSSSCSLSLFLNLSWEHDAIIHKHEALKTTRSFVSCTSDWALGIKG